MDYKQRLHQFNSTDKYKREVEFLTKLIPYNQFNMVLDYGCGLGYTAKELVADGFDVNNYNETLTKHRYYLNELPNGGYNDIYFMHSLAHIPNIKEVLIELKAKYNARVTVITPNLYWLDKDYSSDPTVHKHYTSTQLRELFIECGYTIFIDGQFGEEKSFIHERLFLQAV